MRYFSVKPGSAYSNCCALEGKLRCQKCRGRSFYW